MNNYRSTEKQQIKQIVLLEIELVKKNKWFTPEEREAKIQDLNNLIKNN
jgi:hypothetical protein